MTNESKYSSELINNGPFSVCVIDLSIKSANFGKIRYFNHQFVEMLQSSSEKVADSLLWTHESEATDANLRDRIYKMAIENRFSPCLYSTFRLENGEDIHLKLHIKPNIDDVKDADSAKEMLIFFERLSLNSLCSDGTFAEREQMNFMNTSLIEVNRRLESMLSTLGHELRNHVGSIVMLGDVLNKEVNNCYTIIQDFRTHDSSDNQPVKQFVDEIDAKFSKLRKMFVNIQNSSNKGYNLLEDLFLHKALHTGKQKMKLTFVDIEEMITDLYQEELPEFTKKSIDFEYSVPKESAAFKADPKALHKVLHNLLTNARKFTNKYGTVKISGDLNPDCAIFVVEDNGIGINPKTIPELYDATKPKSSFGTEGEDGTGLGLPICYEIIAAHRGSIEIDSKPNKGTKCTIRIPQPTRLSDFQSKL